MTRRDQLIDLIDDKAPGRLGDGLAIVLLAAPLLLVLARETAGRLTDDAAPALRMPWQAEQRPYAPSATETSPTRGDLLRLARLPAYDALFPERDGATFSTDESGYRNPPSGLGDPFREAPRDVTLVGASFMVTGSFAESLAEHSGLTVYNAAWPGRGALFPLLHLLDEDRVGRAGERVLVFGIVQRSLSAGSGFHHLLARLDEAGAYRAPDGKSRLRGLAHEWLRWPQRLDDHLLKTSPAVAGAERFAAYLPPMALDRGATSAVRLARLEAPRERPMLVLAETLDSVRRPYAARGGDSIREGLRRLKAHCESRGVRLLVVLVPDKLQVFQDHLTPLNFGFSGEESRGEQAITSVLAGRLAEVGVEAVDLLPAFVEALWAGGSGGSGGPDGPEEPLYLLEDTHWSERGSRLAGEIVSERLGR